MIKLYGQTYVKNKSQLVNTLFEIGSTANGTYKLFKDRIELTHTSGEILAVGRERGGAQLPSYTIVVTKCGKSRRYMYSHTALAAQLFSIPESYMDSRSQANDLLVEHSI